MGWNDVKNNSGGGGGGNKIEYMKFPEGVTYFRTISEAPVSRWTHWMPRIKRSVTCIGKGCPICTLIKEAKANKESPQYNSTKKHSMLVINRTTGNVEILDQGSKFFEDMLILHEDEGDIRGFDIKARRKGSDKDTTYRLDAEKKTSLSDADKKLIEDGGFDKFNLEEYFKPPTVEQMVALINGADPKEVFSKSNDIVDEEEESYSVE